MIFIYFQKKNNRKNAGNVLQDELDPATLGNDSISTAQYESRFQLASALEDKVGRVDVEPAATQWKTPQTGRKSRARTSASRTPKTGSGPKRSRMSDSVTPSPVSQQQSPSDAVTPTGTSRKVGLGMGSLIILHSIIKTILVFLLLCLPSVC